MPKITIIQPPINNRISDKPIINISFLRTKIYLIMKKGFDWA